MSSRLREALKLARRFVYASAQTMGRDLLVNDKCGKPYIITPRYALGEIDAALAEPLRNCDVGTPQEQAKRFDVYCHTGGGLCSSIDSCAECVIAWAHMPYESEVK